MLFGLANTLARLGSIGHELPRYWSERKSAVNYALRPAVSQRPVLMP
jgi:hypothetical protein